MFFEIGVDGFVDNWRLHGEFRRRWVLDGSGTFFVGRFRRSKSLKCRLGHNFCFLGRDRRDQWPFLNWLVFNLLYYAFRQMRAFFQLFRQARRALDPWTL